MKILVTGCCGFIGSNVCEYLLKRGDTVLGIDYMDNYYDIKQKEQNLEILNKYPNFEFRKEDIRDTNSISEWKPDIVCNLASMAGVRHSILHPKMYVDININGQIHLIQECIKNNVKHFVYASSSSVYGLNTKIPFSEDDPIDFCNSPYSCSKASMERFAKMYSQIYDISTIGLRFFTVYGPRGRPDMFFFILLKAMIQDKEFEKFGNGDSARDYTYIDDIVSGVVASIDNKKNIKCGVYNLGNSTSVTLNEAISLCEKVVGKKENYKQMEIPDGDVPFTLGDITKAERDLWYFPKTGLEEGLTNTYEWLKNYKT